MVHRIQNRNPGYSDFSGMNMSDSINCLDLKGQHLQIKDEIFEPIDKNCIKTHCQPILNALHNLGCKIIGDKNIRKNFSKKIKIAQIKDMAAKPNSYNKIKKIIRNNNIEDAAYSSADKDIYRARRRFKTYI